MVTQTREPISVMFIQPASPFFYERVEYLLGTLMPGKDRFREDEVAMNIIASQQEAAGIPVELLAKTLNLKVVQRRVRLGQLLQQDLVQALDRLSTCPAVDENLIAEFKQPVA